MRDLLALGTRMAAVALVLLAACGRREVGGGRRDTAGVASAASAATTPNDAASAGQPNDSRAAGAVQYYPAATLATAADALAGGARTGRTLDANASFQYIVMRRTTDGGPEVHDRWADVTFVQAGRGALFSGGRVLGGSVSAPGEHRGGMIVGGTRQQVGAGDLFVVPAGVPHQFLIARGDSLRYVTVKVARPAGR